MLPINLQNSFTSLTLLTAPRTVTPLTNFPFSPTSRPNIRVPRISTSLSATLREPNQPNNFQWQHAGSVKQFKENKPQQVTLNEKKYSVWRQADAIYAIDDACSHQGASLSLGTISEYGCAITCPYHAISFCGESGRMVDNPHGPIRDIPAYHLNAYQTKIQGDQVFILPRPFNINSQPIQDLSLPYLEPEFNEPNFSKVETSKVFAQTAKIVMANSLDLLHISYVHSFGNPKQSLPIAQIGPEKVNGNNGHWKVIYEYVPAEKRGFNQLFNTDSITVENEFILPDTVIVRLSLGESKAAIINRVTPITAETSRIHTTLYENFTGVAFPKPIRKILQPFIDRKLQGSVNKIVEEDRAIVESIDPKSPIFYIQPTEKIQSIFSKQFDAMNKADGNTVDYK